MTDPWQSPQQDPWQSWKGSTGGADANHFERCDALVDKLTTDVQASIQQQGGSHGDDVADAGINKLETDMEEIKAHNATFHNWFKETGNRLARQDEQLAEGGCSDVLGPWGVWSFAETHLSSVTQESCAQQLRSIAAELLNPLC